MNNNVMTIVKKEFARFFGDRRMVMMLFLPGLLIYVMYSFMGTAMADMFSPDEEYVPKAYVVNMPDSLSGDAMGGWSWAEVLAVGVDEVPDADAAKQKVEMKEAELVVVFPPDFDAEVESYNVRSADGSAPNIEIFYNSTNMNSQGAFGLLLNLLDSYESSLSNKFDINRDVSDANLASEEDAAATLISSLMPLLLIMFLYSGCIAIAPESIAGEKERGTIGTLLVSPLKRSQLATGKILSLGAIAISSGFVSAVATILSLPKLMGIDGGDLNVNIYAPQDYIMLSLVILTTVLLLVAVISMLSALAKTVKEVNTFVMPLMIVIMLAGVSSMFGGAQAERIYYLIPIYNSVHCMHGVFSLEYDTMNVILTILSNLAYACIGSVALTKMFNSEKIMFSR